MKRRNPSAFGGSIFKGYNPSRPRPLDEKKALHLVLKSSKATGRRSFKNKLFEQKIFDIIDKHARLNGIKLYSYANSGNHLHILMRAKTRDSYNRFIRTVTGLIARLVMAKERGLARLESEGRGTRLKKGLGGEIGKVGSVSLSKKGSSFWDGRPFTRIVSFGRRDFEKVKDYLLRNTLETIGWIKYHNRSTKLTPEWKAFFCTHIEFP